MKSVENIFGYIREQFYRFSRGCKPRENLWNCLRKYPKMFETYFIFRQQKIEFKPMSGVIMLLCNRMFCWIFGGFPLLPVSPLPVFPTSGFFHIPYLSTLLVNLISKPYRWTLVVNLIGKPYWWTLFMHLICSIWQNLINSPTLFGNLIHESYILVFPTSGFFTTSGFFHFRFVTTSGFFHFRVSTASGFFHFRFWCKPEMGKNRKLENPEVVKNRKWNNRKIRFTNKVHKLLKNYSICQL